MWFFLLKEGNWYDKNNVKRAVCNFIVFIIGFFIFIAGTYASIDQIVSGFGCLREYMELTSLQIAKFNRGEVGRPFSCNVA